MKVTKENTIQRTKTARHFLDVVTHIQTSAFGTEYVCHWHNIETGGYGSGVYCKTAAEALAAHADRVSLYGPMQEPREAPTEEPGR